MDLLLELLNGYTIESTLLAVAVTASLYVAWKKDLLNTSTAVGIWVAVQSVIRLWTNQNTSDLPSEPTREAADVETQDYPSDETIHEEAEDAADEMSLDEADDVARSAGDLFSDTDRDG